MLTAIAALVAGGCEYYDKPNLPLPRDFRVVTLGGKVLDRAELKGRPAVLAFWVPG